jgi:uncharacterized membrane protein YoaT (DUF817 family)
MRTKMTAKDAIVVKYISSLTNKDYSLFFTYHRIEDVQEVIRGNYLLPLSDTPVYFKVKDNDFIMFKTKKAGVIADFVCLNKGDRFDLYEMNTGSFSKYEQYMQKRAK